jgi:hypothetical protein
MKQNSRQVHEAAAAHATDGISVVETSQKRHVLV